MARERDLASPRSPAAIGALLIGVLTWISAAAAGETPDPVEFSQEERESHRRMLGDLEQVREESAKFHPFIGRFELDRLRTEARAETPGASAEARFDLLLRLGTAELEHGYERDAIARLESALELVRDGGARGAVFPPESVQQTLHTFVVAKLRLGETENCCEANHPESCIFPISEAAVHLRREGSEEAMAHLRMMLEHRPLDAFEKAQAVWLLNLAAMTLGEHPHGVPEPWRVLVPDEAAPFLGSGEPANPPPFPVFENVAAKAGVDTFSLSGGAVADDFDGDGWIDLAVASWDPAEDVKIFLNRGDGSFEQIDAGLAGIGGGLNLRHADFDNDGHLDILVLRGAWLGERGRHPNSLLRNDGRGRFVDVTHAVGLAEPAWPTQTAEWADYDLDGDLDLFVGNESGEVGEARAQLFRNDGGVFTDVAEAAGLDLRAFVNGASWGDFDGDGWPDLFVSCMDAPNRLYRNRGDGTFEDVSHLLGPTAGPLRSFAAWWFDYDDDGWPDLFVSNYGALGIDFVHHYRGGSLDPAAMPALFRNEEGRGFRDVTLEAGLDRPMLPMGSNFGDLTNNGFPDIYLGTGTPDFDALVPNLLLVNDGSRFHDLTVAARMGHLQKGHAVAMADFDRDGNLDVFQQMGGALPGDRYFDVLYDNPGFGNGWLGVRLRGTRTNRFGVGCRVLVVVAEPGGGERRIYQWMNGGGSFGGNPLELHFGLGGASEAKRVEVFWPVTGRTQKLENVAGGRTVTIEEDP